MREIKFRGRRKDGKWLYGDLIHNRGGVYIADDSVVDGTDIQGHTDFSVIPESVGQFTGMVDCNGKEIYEGDILDIGDDTVKAYYDFDTIKVEWSDRFACYGQKVQRSVEDVEEEIDIVMGNESLSPDDYKGWYDLIGSYFIDICHMLRLSFSQPKPEFKVIGNIHDNPELMKGGEI